MSLGFGGGRGLSYKLLKTKTSYHSLASDSKEAGALTCNEFAKGRKSEVKFKEKMTLSPYIQ
jgi:hypothetical protein